MNAWSKSKTRLLKFFFEMEKSVMVEQSEVGLLLQDLFVYSAAY